jgi:hypothetical protein
MVARREVEAVANPVNRGDLWHLRRLSQLDAQPVDQDAENVVRATVGAPHLTEKVPAVLDAPGPGHEEGEEIELPWRERDLLTPAAQDAGVVVQLKAAEGGRPAGVRRLTSVQAGGHVDDGVDVERCE